MAVLASNVWRSSASLGRLSGLGTSGIGTWCDRPGSCMWNETDIEKIACPCWIAITRRVVKLLPSRIRSTS